MNAQNVRGFVLHTGYPLDKIIYLPPVFSFLNDGSSIPYLIPHNLDFAPLVDGSWDLTPNFDTNYEYFSGTVPSPAPNFSPFGIWVDIAADETNIIITPHNITGINVTCYARVFGLQPSDSNSDVPFTASLGNDFILNTDNNYTKLYKSNFINSPANSATIPIVHDLGARVQFKAWVTNFGQTEPMRGDLITSGSPTAFVAAVIEDTQILIKTSPFADIERIDYRIYIDESGI